MTPTETLRARFSDLGTDALREMWATEARVEWAEQVLREELLARGVSAAELGGVAARREEIAGSAPPSARDTLWSYGVVGRSAALFAAAIALFVFKSLVGTRAGVFAMAVVFAVYVVILVRRVFFQSHFRVSGGATFAMIWQCAEAVLLLAGLVVVAATLPSQA